MSFTWKQISQKEADKDLFCVLDNHIPVLPLVDIINQYLKTPEFTREHSYYEMHRNNPNSVRLHPEFISQNYNNLIYMDAISEIEMTQDVRLNGCFYRSYVRVFKKLKSTNVKDIKRTLEPELVYYSPDMGSPNNNWPLPFSGPCLESLPKRAIYQLSTGAIFEMDRLGYQCRFTRRV